MLQTTKTLLLCIGITLLAACKSEQKTSNEAASTEKAPISFNADSAFVHIQAQCAFGARVPGSDAHQKCGDYIVKSFKQYGLNVQEQTAPQSTWDGKQYTLRNIIASYKPEAAKRIVIAAHWDSRPWSDADADSTKHHQAVMGANDGASGVAVILEIARQLHLLNPSVGIDFVCFDLEDYGTPYWGENAPSDGSDWCLGSQHWSKNVAQDYKPAYGILLDMVGGADARFRYEYYSRRYAEEVLAKVWAAAATVGASHLFLNENGNPVTDDHLPMNQTANIPTIDIIADNGHGFSSTWHTVYDTPEQISKPTLEAVGQTLLQVIFEEK